ncbi:MAG: iron ABC transporter permease [Lachnospiraceae bacterium]|nr:iron ABC transporter permease [Lachnospiraceae bacterium]
MQNKRSKLTFIFLIFLLIVMLLVSIMSGSVRIGAWEVIHMISGKKDDLMNYNIIYNIRLPRTIAAFFLGGALALSGYLLQTFFNNPIAGPFVLGISSGAKLTVALTMIFLLERGKTINSAGMILSAFAGAMAAMGFVLIVSFYVRNMSILIVCGIMTGYICSAVTDLVVTFADDSNIINLHNWSLGSFSGIDIKDVKEIVIITVIGLIMVLMLVKPIGAYRLGETYAKNMGVNIKLLRAALIVLSSILAATVTAYAGPISFVGIAVPHILKSMTGTSSPGVMIPGCFMTGALITLFCDCIARTVFAPTEVSISSVTAVLLVPVVISMLVKRHMAQS